MASFPTIAALLSPTRQLQVMVTAIAVVKSKVWPPLSYFYGPPGKKIHRFAQGKHTTQDNRLGVGEFIWIIVEQFFNHLALFAKRLPVRWHLAQEGFNFDPRQWWVPGRVHLVRHGLPLAGVTYVAGKALFGPLDGITNVDHAESLLLSW